MGKCSISIGVGSVTLLLSCLGYFIYGGVDGFVATLAYNIGLSFLSLTGFIPLIGTIIYCLVGWFWWQPLIFGFSGIYSTWLTNLIFAIGAIISAIYGLLTFVAFLD